MLFKHVFFCSVLVFSGNFLLASDQNTFDVNSILMKIKAMLAAKKIKDQHAMIYHYNESLRNLVLSEHKDRLVILERMKKKEKAKKEKLLVQSEIKTVSKSQNSPDAITALKKIRNILATQNVKKAEQPLEEVDRIKEIEHQLTDSYNILLRQLISLENQDRKNILQQMKYKEKLISNRPLAEPDRP